LKAAAPAHSSRPGAARCRTRTHRDKGNDADFTINLPTLHDKPGYPGTVRSSRRSVRRPAVGLCVRLRTDHPDRHGVGRPPQRPDCRPYRRISRDSRVQPQSLSVIATLARRVRYRRIRTW